MGNSSPTSEYLSPHSQTMAMTLPRSNMRLGYAAPSAAFTTAQPPLRDFRQSFKPGSWASTSVSLELSIQVEFRLTRRVQGGPSWSPQRDAAPLSSAEMAAILQLQFDEEDRMLAAERAGLAAAAQRVFDCGVCMDTLPEESIARIDPCGHSFCRECVRSLVVSQIESRRFPVLCPTCTADRRTGTEETGSKSNRGHVSS